MASNDNDHLPKVPTETMFQRELTTEYKQYRFWAIVYVLLASVPLIVYFFGEILIGFGIYYYQYFDVENIFALYFWTITPICSFLATVNLRGMKKSTKFQIRIAPGMLPIPLAQDSTKQNKSSGILEGILFLPIAYILFMFGGVILLALLTALGVINWMG